MADVHSTRRWPVILVAASVLAGSVALGACGGGSISSGTTGTTSPPVSPATSGPGPGTAASRVPASPSSACTSRKATVPAGDVNLAPVIDGRTRTAIVHIPTGYRPPTPAALVLNLHGSQSTARAQEGFSGMDATADARTFVVVYPQGGIAAGNGYEWNVPGQPLFGGAAVPSTAPDDMSFLQQLVTLLEQKYCIDENRVFATGFSGGARMTSQLGCDASKVFGAIAPVSGLRFPAPCASARAMPVVSFHGTADPVDPYNGNGQGYWTYSVPVAATRWAGHNGCASGPIQSHPAPGVTLGVYGGCSAPYVAVELYTIAGAGHEWPGGPHLPAALTRVLGPQSNAIDANETMWSFFVAHPL